MHQNTLNQMMRTISLTIRQCPDRAHAVIKEDTVQQPYLKPSSLLHLQGVCTLSVHISLLHTCSMLPLVLQVQPTSTEQGKGLLPCMEVSSTTQSSFAPTLQAADLAATLSTAPAQELPADVLQQVR